MGSDFPKHGLRRLAQGDNHFWFEHRNRIIRLYLKKHLGDIEGARILELGCGAATIGRFLADSGFNVTVSDTDETFFELSRGLDGFCFDLTQGQTPSDQVGGYDVVVLGDVIEHLDNPIDALRLCSQFLRPNGLCLITVPALSFLWSSYDVFTMHKRRYGKHLLKTHLALAGFHDIKADFFFVLPAVLLFIKRVIAQRNVSDDVHRESLQIGDNINQMMKKIMLIEELGFSKVSLPFGSSLIASGRKSA